MGEGIRHRRGRPLLGPSLLFALLGAFYVLPFHGDHIVSSSAPDLTSHLSGIVEAHSALREGQFPVRIAPTPLGGQRYPLFQFYGNFPYTFAALFTLFGANAYTAWKIVTAITVASGGFYTYRCALALTRQAWPAVAAGAVFALSPYLATDVAARFAYPEAVSFCLLPAAAFYTWRAFASRRRAAGAIVAGGVAWALVALSHNVTYLYASLLIGLFFASCLTLSPRRDSPRLLRAGACYGLGVLLVLWYVVPQLRVLDVITMSQALAPPSASAAYVPLRVLLSPRITIAPVAIGTPYLGLQVGWPILAAVALGVAQLLRGRAPRRSLGRSILARLLAATTLLVFAVWTPVDFWPWVPRVFWNIQFTYRLLMFVVLAGSLAAAVALALAFRGRGGMSPRAGGVALLLVAVAATPYVLWQRRTLPRSVLYGLMDRPDLGGQAVANYRPVPDRIEPYRLAVPAGVPVLSKDQTLTRTTYGKTITYASPRPQRVVAQLPVLFYPHLWDVRLRGRALPYGHIDGYLAVELPPGRRVVRVRFVGVHWANYLSAAAWALVIASGAVWASKRFRLPRPAARQSKPVSRGSRAAAFPLTAGVLAFALLAVPLVLAGAYPPVKSALYRRAAGRVYASSESDPRLLAAANAFDDDGETAWAADGGGPATMTIVPPRPRTVARVVLEPRRTALFEGWHKVGVVLYFGGRKVGEQSFEPPDAERSAVQELKLDAPALADRIELHFAEPITLTFDGRRVDPGVVNPGYREIRVLSD